MRARVLPPLALLGALALGSNVAGQVRLTGADVKGVITDPSGAVLPGVTVITTSLDTNVVRTQTSDDQGRYLIPALPPGFYRITAELAGFATGTRESVRLQVGELVDVSFSLAVAGVEQRVDVVPTVPVVNPFRTAVSFVVDSRQIADLPINGRRFVSFAALSPGVVPAGSTEAGADSSGLSFAGGRPVSNNLMVDGLDNNDRILGGANTSFSQEAIREFQVLTTSYPAEFGNATGGILNIVTRSGTNVVHGGAFAFYRNDALSARNYFERFDPYGDKRNTDEAPFEQAMWGGSAGLPIRRDRTFLFAAAERVTVDANNVVTIDPAVAAALTAGGYPVEVGNVPYDFRLTQASARIDHHWTPTRHLTMRVQGSDVTNENYGPFGGLVARSHGAVQLRTDWGVSASQTDVIGDHWVNEARLQYSVQNQQTLSLDPACGRWCTGTALGQPEVQLLGLATVGRSSTEPTDRLNRSLQLKNTVTRAGDRHTLKAGVDYTYVDQDALLSLQFSGGYVFSALPAIPGLLPVGINAVQAFQAGLPVYYTQGYGDGTSPFTYQELAAFLQDDWQIGSRLTIKAGLRFQRQRFPDIDFTVPGPGGTGVTYPFPLGGNNLSPRLAAAYDVSGDGRTSIHAAYGLFFGNQLTTPFGFTEVFTRPEGTRLHLFPFPASLAGWQMPDRRLPDTGAPYPRVSISISQQAKTPRVHQASVGVSHALTDDLGLSADVVYARGSHQLGELDYNPLVPALGPGRRPNDVAGVAGTSTSVLQFTDFGRTWYTGLLVSLRKRLSSGYAYGVAYTWATAEDNVSRFTGLVNDTGRGRNPADPAGLPLGFDPLSERGPSEFNQQHRLVAEGVWVPYGGVQVAGLLTVNSGLPFTARAGVDLNGDGFPQSDRARTNPLDPTTAVGRNRERLPSQATLDLRVSRPVKLSSRVSVVPAVEVFNLFNRTNYSEVNDVFGAGSFPAAPARDERGRVSYGTYQKALAARQVQVMLRVTF